MSKRSGLPANPIAEKALLGALLKGGDGYFSVADTVRADCFASDLHQKIFSAIKDICEAGNRLSLTVLASRLPQEDDEGRSVESYLSVLLHDAQDVSPSDFAYDVAETANRRRIIQIAESAAKAAYAGNKPALDIAAETEAAVLDVMQVSAPNRPKKLSFIVEKVMHASSIARDQDLMPGLNTGLPPLDEILGLILPTDLGFIIAAQSEGKSALATQIAMHVARTKPVLVYQLEMGEEQIAARELAAASGVPVGKIEEGASNVFEYQELQQAEETLKSADLWIMDAGQITVRQMRSHALAMQRTTGLGMMVVDQLDKIRTESRHRDKFERLAEVTRDLKVLAKEVRVPIITLAQRTRFSQRRPDPVPRIDDTDANSIERDGDWVIGLWQEHMWLMKNRPDKNSRDAEWDEWKSNLEHSKGFAEIITLKRRRGRAFEQRKLRWHGEITRFETL